MEFLSKIRFKGLLLVIGVLIMISSCIQGIRYPDKPAITFVAYNFTIGPDETGTPNVHLGLLTISFTDGDGDLGLLDSDTIYPYDFNIFIHRIGISNGSPVYSNVDTVRFRTQYLTPEGQNKTLAGEIDIELNVYPTIFQYDTMFMEVYIKDRALHASNTIITPEIAL